MKNINFESVGVVGLGYVGTSIATVLAESGLDICGVDVDSEKVAEINEAMCPIEEDGITEKFERYVENGRISATTSFEDMSSCEAIVVTVGTPLAKNDPDLSAVKAASRDLGSVIEEGQLIVFRSTIPPKTTSEIIRPILEDESELSSGEDFYLAFCPERMAEGSAYSDLTNIPVVVGGVDEYSGKVAETFWNEVGLETFRVSDATTAELSKLADNWWIDLNIALANELALLSEKIGVDSMEVISAANTLPKGEHNVNILFPGTGVGGSCLIKDPWFVVRMGEKQGLDIQTPRVSREVNDRMPYHFVDLILDTLNERNIETEDAKVAVLGYAFKGETDDTRNTPVKVVIEELEKREFNIRVTDPYVPSGKIESELGLKPKRLPESLKSVDVVAICTGHETYRELEVSDIIEYVGNNSFSVVDGRHVFDGDEFDGTNISYKRVGSGK